MLKRKAYDSLKDWKENFAPHYAALLEGARRVGKSTIAEEFAKENYHTYIKIDFAHISNDLLSAFKDIAKLDALAAQSRLLCQNRISTADELQAYMEHLEAKLTDKGIKLLAGKSMDELVEV